MISKGMETIIGQIEKALAEFKINSLNEDTKLECLNVVNGILYPLKEDKTINDFYLSASIQESDLVVSVSIKETPEVNHECWELVIQKRD